MKVKWQQGEWKDGKPVIHEGHDYVWYVIDYRFARPQCVEPHSVDFALRTHFYSKQLQSKDEGGGMDCAPPNWWWAPQERPDKLPKGHPRANW